VHCVYNEELEFTKDVKYIKCLKSLKLNEQLLAFQSQKFKLSKFKEAESSTINEELTAKQENEHQ